MGKLVWAASPFPAQGQGSARVSPGLVPGVEDSGDRRAEQQAQQVGDARGAVTHDELA